MKRLYSWASTILSKLAGKPFKGLVLRFGPGFESGHF